MLVKRSSYCRSSLSLKRGHCDISWSVSQTPHLPLPLRTCPTISHFPGGRCTFSPLHLLPHLFPVNRTEQQLLTTVPRSPRNQVILSLPEQIPAISITPVAAPREMPAGSSLRAQQLGWCKEGFLLLQSQLPRRRNGGPSPPIPNTICKKAGLFLSRVVYWKGRRIITGTKARKNGMGSKLL